MLSGGCLSRGVQFHDEETEIIWTDERIRNSFNDNKKLNVNDYREALYRRAAEREEQLKQRGREVPATVAPPSRRG